MKQKGRSHFICDTFADRANAFSGQIFGQWQWIIKNKCVSISLKTEWSETIPKINQFMF